MFKIIDLLYNREFLLWANETTIHNVTNMLVLLQKVLFSNHNHLLTTGPDDPTSWLLLKRQQVKGHQ